MRLTGRGRAVIAVLVAGLVGAGAFLLFRPAPTGGPAPVTTPTATAEPSGTVDDGGPRPYVAWSVVDDQTHQVEVDRGEGLEVVYATGGAAVLPVGWFVADSVPDRLVLLAGQDLYDLLSVDLTTGADTPLDPRPAADAWTDEVGNLSAVLVDDEGGYRLVRWDASGQVVSDEGVDEVPRHATPAAASEPPVTFEPVPGFLVEWAGTPEASTLTVDSTLVAEGRVTQVVLWPPAGRAPTGS